MSFLKAKQSDKASSKLQGQGDTEPTQHPIVGTQRAWHESPEEIEFSGLGASENAACFDRVPFGMWLTITEILQSALGLVESATSRMRCFVRRKKYRASSRVIIRLYGTVRLKQNQQPTGLLQHVFRSQA